MNKIVCKNTLWRKFGRYRERTSSDFRWTPWSGVLKIALGLSNESKGTIAIFFFS